VAFPPTISLERWVPHPQAVAGNRVLALSSTVLIAAGSFLMFAWAVSKLGGYSPFLYFQF
jgi:alginate O-acetyltransferase complex protein AlgI